LNDPSPLPPHARFWSRRGFIRLHGNPRYHSYEGDIPRVLNFQLNMPYLAYINQREGKAYVVNRFYQQLGTPEDRSVRLVHPPHDHQRNLYPGSRRPWRDAASRAEYFENLRRLEGEFKVVYTWQGFVREGRTRWARAERGG
jgi:hypothetical protein